MHDIAVIGAGPYGLSIGAHLARAGRDFRIFGTPMQTWRTQMPLGMKLKSEGFASTLYDPDASYRLSHHCKTHGLPYADIGLPVPLAVFSGYGLAFQKRFVPNLEERQVVSLHHDGDSFIVSLEGGEEARFRQVISAAGITHYAHVAPELRGLAPALMSHASEHSDLSVFAGKDVVVVGGGASAADCAALLSEAGARVRMVARRARLSFHAPPKRRSRWEKLRRPATTIGPGWKYVACVNAPDMFHAMPEQFRLGATRRVLGPAPCWFVRDQIERQVDMLMGMQIGSARMRGGRAVLSLAGETGARELEADHVIAATGYRVDLGRLPFLGAELRSRIKAVENTPVLTRSFESSMPGLFFVGATAANAFGPLLRFACGAEFTAKRIAKRI
jgi:cation diffusion facilitator CzcD-associated flavoprotein CzcO